MRRRLNCGCGQRPRGDTGDDNWADVYLGGGARVHGRRVSVRVESNGNVGRESASVPGGGPGSLLGRRRASTRDSEPGSWVYSNAVPGAQHGVFLSGLRALWERMRSRDVHGAQLLRSARTGHSTRCGMTWLGIDIKRALASEWWRGQLPIGNTDCHRKHPAAIIF